MRSQDIITALVLVLQDETPTYAELAELSGLSTSEAHASVGRLRDAAIVDGDRHVIQRSLLDFLVHGAPFAFPGTPGGLTLGVPTGGLAPGLDAAPRPEQALVWPSEDGAMRGLALEPLHPRVPTIVGENPRLYTLLAAVDILRCRPAARERSAAIDVLTRALSIGVVARMLDSGTPGEVRGADALEQVFAHRRVLTTIRHAASDGPGHDDPVFHPYQDILLAAYAPDIAHHLATSVRGGTFAPGPACTLTEQKADGGIRTFVFPQLIDRIAALRLVEALEAPVRAKDDGRVFLPRRHSAGPLEDIVYTDTGGQWRAFVDSIRSASGDGQFATVLRADVQEFFSSIRPEIAREAVARVTGAHPIAIALLVRLLDTWTPDTGYRPDGGLPVEPTDASRLVAHCILKAVDEQFEDDFELRYRRFMDDVVILADSAETASRAQERHRLALAALGLRHNTQKTCQMDTSAYLEDVLATQLHEQLDELEDGRQLGWWLENRWNPPERVRPPTTGVLRRLYAMARQYDSSELEERCSLDVHVPGLLASVASYLCRRPLVSDDVDLLFDQIDSTSSSAVGRVRVACALTDARFANGESKAVMKRAIATIRQASAPGAAIAQLVYLAFKHRLGQIDDLLDSGTNPGGDPHLGMAWLAVCRASGRPLPSAARVAMAASGRSDVALTERLLDDLESGDIDLDVLFGTLWRRGTIDASHLPLLHIVARSRRETVRSRVGTWLCDRLDDAEPIRDDVVRKHLELCLDLVGADDDVRA